MKTNLIDEAIKIPANERVQLAELLLASIDYESDIIAKSWLDEVKNRMQSVKLGKTKLVSLII